jgi:hypothetical protein
MKKWLRTIRDMLLFILLAPQFFVFSYYFSYFFKGANKLSLAKSLFVLAITVALVSAPFLLALAFAVKIMLTRRWRWHTILPLSFMGGFLWLVLWNLTIYKSFSYARSLLPLLMCSIIMVGFALAHRMREDTAPKTKTGENTVSGLPE